MWVKKALGRQDSGLLLSKIYGLLRTKGVPHTDLLHSTPTVGGIFITTHPLGSANHREVTERLPRGCRGVYVQYYSSASIIDDF